MAFFRTTLPTMSATVFTIGYQGSSLEQLVETLSAAEVSVLVDTRETPTSRGPEFRPRSLETALGDAGIDYLAASALGAPKALRAIASNDWDVFADGYRDRLSVVREELERLVPSSVPNASASSALRPTPTPVIARCSPMRSRVCWTLLLSAIFGRGGRRRPMITKLCG